MTNQYIPVQIDQNHANLMNATIPTLVDIYFQNHRFVAEPGNGDEWEIKQENIAIQEMWDIHNILVQYN